MENTRGHQGASFPMLGDGGLACHVSFTMLL